MLMAVKNQFKVTLLSIKYALIREMLNKATFISNIVFMMLNNACFIVQWIIIYSINDSIGSYVFKDILLLWGIAAFTFGASRFFFKKAFNLSEIINNGKLDAAIVQPKNILLSVITSDIEVSGIGDMMYGYIMLIVYGISLKNFVLFTLFGLEGALIITAAGILGGSLSFWINRSDAIADSYNGLLINFATYPDSIFNGVVKIMLYTIVPIYFVNYIPLHVIKEFDMLGFIGINLVTLLSVTLAFIVFYRGLKRYSSSNLMGSRI